MNVPPIKVGQEKILRSLVGIDGGQCFSVYAYKHKLYVKITKLPSSQSQNLEENLRRVIPSFI
ncbi:MAG: hypothetical protein EBX03_14370 [Rhodobacteraceae bacterium]|nr:hypothetical protein [Paracoccaceae bacterium]